jgi:hypothetical protein
MQGTCRPNHMRDDESYQEVSEQVRKSVPTFAQVLTTRKQNQ